MSNLNGVNKLKLDTEGWQIMKFKILHMIFVVVVTALFNIIAAYSSAPPKANNILSVTVQVDSKKGTPAYLIVKGEVKDGVGYICRSYYKKGYDKTKWWSEGNHLIEEVQKGEFLNKYPIAADYINGVYEVSLFKSRQFKNQCRIIKGGCYFCNKWGYHLTDLLAYKTGFIKAAAK